MIRDDAHWLALTDAFYSAAIEGSDWYEALEGLAEATGSRCGELVGFGSNAVIPFNIMTNIDPEFVHEFEASGGGDPNVNPRVKVGMESPVLRVMAECDFMTPEEHKTNRHYNEFARPWDVPYICLATLEREKDLMIGLAVARSERQGHITPEQRANFAALAAHVRAAVRTQLALEGQGIHLVTGTLEAMSLAAFVCDRTGLVRAHTAAAETVINGGRGLKLRCGYLTAINPFDQKNLDSALLTAALGVAQPGKPLLRSILIRGATTDQPPMVLDIISLPSREYQFGFVPRVLVVVRGPKRSDEEKAQILQFAYGLTAAEADITLRLSRGQSAEAIALARNVTQGTVRAQIKTILGKCGVKKQIELIARLEGLA